MAKKRPPVVTPVAPATPSRSPRRDDSVSFAPVATAPKPLAKPSAVSIPPIVVPPPSVEPFGLSVPPQLRAQALEIIAREVAGCTRCPELASTRTQTVFGTGDPNAQLCFLGEAPGAQEDAQGEPFVGRSGQLLTDMITKGMKVRREDVYILNIIKCRPPDNRNPTNQESANCREYLNRQLEAIRPKYICCLGSVAAKNLLETEVSIGRLRGKFHDYRGIPVLCTYHPAYVLRNPISKKDVWEDLQLLMKLMGLPT